MLISQCDSVMLSLTNDAIYSDLPTRLAGNCRPVEGLKMMKKSKQSLFRPRSLKSLRLIVVSALTEAGKSQISTIKGGAFLCAGSELVSTAIMFTDGGDWTYLDILKFSNAPH